MNFEQFSDSQGAQPLRPFSEQEFNKYRGDFFQFALIHASHVVGESEFVNLNPPDAIQAMVVTAVGMGLQMDLFRPDVTDKIDLSQLPPDVQEDLKELWADAIPWSIVRFIADSFNVDAQKILADHMRHLTQNISNSHALSVSNIDIDGIDVQEYTKFIMKKIEELEDSEDEQDRYMLHCVHDGHACQHPFIELQGAILHAAEGTKTGWLQSVSNITRDGEEVMSADAVRKRVDEILSIGSN